MKRFIGPSVGALVILMLSGSFEMALIFLIVGLCARGIIERLSRGCHE